MRILLLFFFLYACTVSWGQLQFSQDTLFYHERIGGRLDSVDIANSQYPSIFDGGKDIRSSASLNPFALTNDLKYHTLLPQEGQRLPLRFSALPHLGFAYSFGSQGTQFVRATYQQAFTQNLVLNIDFAKNLSQGYLRNSSFNMNDLRMDLARQGKCYSFRLNGWYGSLKSEHPGGITTDALIDAYGLEYTPVYKQQAESQYKIGNLALVNYFDMTKDSTRQFGIMTFHRYQIVNRLFTESDTLYGIYSQINVDSLDTRDQYNLPSIENGAGLFTTRSNRWYADLILSHRYWDYQNLAMHWDTTELYIHSSQMLHIGGMILSNQLDYNLSGAYNGVKDALKISYKAGKVTMHGLLNYNDLAPDVMDRRQFANTFNYSLSVPNRNQWVTGKIGGDISVVDSLLKVGADLSLSQVSKMYLFDGTNWRNDTLQNYSFGSADFRLAFSYKALQIRTLFRYSFDPRSFLPQIQEYSRFYLKGYLFKAKKLQAMIGVEQNYISDYRKRNYFVNADLFNWFSNTGTIPSMVNMNAFVNLGIDEFRFYFRFENIGYFWNDKTTLLLDGYPLAGTRLRVGITWDFFN